MRPEESARDAVDEALEFIDGFMAGSNNSPPPELAARPVFTRIFNELDELKKALASFSGGRLDMDLPDDGAAMRHLKRLQLELRRLAWQLCAVAAGDLNQKMPPFGDLSDAFNRMTDSLKRHWLELAAQKEQLDRLARDLHEEVRKKEALEQTLRVSENAYRQMALHDPLTGIHNRAYFFEIACREIEKLKRGRGQFCLLMLDVDHFKNFNDDFGHLAGDEALRHITATVGRHLRKCDLQARYGGEEFVLLLGGTSLLFGHAIAERIRKAVAAAPPPTPESRGLTVSLGLTHLDHRRAAAGPPSADLLNTIIAEADEALYAAKNNGRNQARLFKDGGGAGGGL